MLTKPVRGFYTRPMFADYFIQPRPCSREELGETWVIDAASKMGEPFKYHRKLWEYAVVLEAFESLEPFNALGFGVGAEPLPKYFAAFGSEVTATDQPPDTAGDWTNTGQYSGKEISGERLTFVEHDMRRPLPREWFGEFEFVWSCCALEHLGGINAGVAFVLESTRAMKPGTWAFHTTEYNFSSNQRTVEADNLCLYRKRDLEFLIATLREAGFDVLDPDFAVDFSPADLAAQDLVVKVGDFLTTSYVIPIYKP